jgi:hypothetical protein
MYIIIFVYNRHIFFFHFHFKEEPYIPEIFVKIIFVTMLIIIKFEYGRLAK